MKPYKPSFQYLLVFIIVSVSQNFSRENKNIQEQKDNKAKRSGFAVVNGVWPISNSTTIPDELSSPFGPRNLAPTYPYDFHDGVDIRTFSNGVNVHAFYIGTVVAKGTFTTRSGLSASFVRIEHQDPTDLDYFWTEYVHVEMDGKFNALIPNVTMVTKGQDILDSGAVGTTSPHLHFNGLTYPNPTIRPPAPLPDREIDAINPMRTDALNYTFNFGPRLVNLNCKLTGTGRFAEFEVLTNDTEFDLNKIDLSYGAEKISIVFDGPRGNRMNTDAMKNNNSNGMPGDEDGIIMGAKTSSNNTITITITTFSFDPDLNNEQRIKFRYTALPVQWTNPGSLIAEAFDTKNVSSFPNFFNCVTSVDDEDDLRTNGIPDRFTLLQNYPNPFNPSTTIRFALPKKSLISLAIYDEHGSLVRELAAQKLYDAGENELVWDGSNTAGLPVASGAYFYRLNAEGLDNKKFFSQTKKLLLVR